MKILIRITVISLILGLVLIVSGFALGGSYDTVKSLLTDTSDYEAKSFDATAHFEKLVVNTESRNVEIRHGDVSYATATYYLKDSETASFDLVGDTLNVSIGREEGFFNWFSFGWPSSEVITLYITLPNDYLIDVETQTMSGYILMDGQFKDTFVEALSGSINLKGTFNTLDVSVYSGMITISDSEVLTTLDVIGKSGLITLTNSHITGHVDIEAMSGMINVSKTTGSGFNLKTASGSISVSLEDIVSTYEFRLSVGSGLIKLNQNVVSNPYHAGSGILVECQTGSGSINIVTE